MSGIRTKKKTGAIPHARRDVTIAQRFQAKPPEVQHVVSVLAEQIARREIHTARQAEHWTRRALDHWDDWLRDIEPLQPGAEVKFARVVLRRLSKIPIQPPGKS